jgi:hypothetical protein
LKPLDVAAVVYDGNVVTLEHKPYYENAAEMPVSVAGMWLSNSERHMLQMKVAITTQQVSGLWFIDGTYIYWLPSDPISFIIDRCDHVTSDRRFKVVPVDAYSLPHLSDTGEYVMFRRYSLAYHAKGTVGISPPCWADVSRIGAKKVKNEDGDKRYPFDTVDNHLSVNLTFTLKAAKVLSRIFNYEFVSPLQLPDLMIRLRTVNLLSVTKQIKMTFPVGIPFTHALAWLIGTTTKVTKFSDMVEMRGLFKYLTTKGLFHNEVLSQKAVFVKGKGIADIPLKTLEAAAEEGREIGLKSDYMVGLASARRRATQRREGDVFEATTVGGDE